MMTEQENFISEKNYNKIKQRRYMNFGSNFQVAWYDSKLNTLQAPKHKETLYSTILLATTQRDEKGKFCLIILT